jgi:cystathionine gamma-lyase/cystathionine beta-lyase/cystathionine gamma-lyase/homocysteine desulfhydrase
MKLPPGARFPTICIHAGQTPDPGTGAIITPIFQTSTYVQEELGKHKGFEYARTQNPTRTALEANLAAIEGGAAAFAFASGMAAIDAITTLLQAGDHVVVTDNTYGGTFRLFDKVLTRYKLDFSYVDTSKPDLVERAMRPNTKMLFVETPTNPVLRLTDIAATADLAHRRGVRLVVDNTFASPAVQRPMDLGADIVTHSTTKYLNGHSDSVGGVVIAQREDDIAWLKFIQNAAGAILSPFDSWLVLRGTKTLTVRMAQHNANGMALAEFLSSHPRVKHVIYPGLPSHPQHDLAKRQMRGFGGMVSFDVGTFEAARDVCNRVKLM